MRLALSAHPASSMSSRPLIAGLTLGAVGLVAVAAPVRDARGHIVAAVNVSAPKFRLDRQLEAAGRHVLAAAASLSSTLGNIPAPAAARA